MVWLLACSAPSPTPKLEINALDFGPVVVGATQTQLLGIENTGDAPAILDSITLDTSTGFALVGETPQELSPGRTELEISFAPLFSGVWDASLYLDSNDPTHPSLKFPLSGTGISPSFSTPECS